MQKMFPRVSALYVRLLAVHGDKPHLWVAAADWEMNKIHSADVARKLLLRGMKRHPQSQELYLAVR